MGPGFRVRVENGSYDVIRLTPRSRVRVSAIRSGVAWVSEELDKTTSDVCAQGLECTSEYMGWRAQQALTETQAGAVTRHFA